MERIPSTHSYMQIINSETPQTFLNDSQQLLLPPVKKSLRKRAQQTRQAGKEELYCLSVGKMWNTHFSSTYRFLLLEIQSEINVAACWWQCLFPKLQANMMTSRRNSLSKLKKAIRRFNKRVWMFTKKYFL